VLRHQNLLADKICLNPIERKWNVKKMNDRIIAKFKLQNVGSIMKCNTLESERDFVILRMYAQKIPTFGTEGA